MLLGRRGVFASVYIVSKAHMLAYARKVCIRLVYTRVAYAREAHTKETYAREKCARRVC